jgi:uncharacterized protein YjbI with pentapeptide repeats
MMTADLSNANLSQASLVGVDLCGATLAGANLSDTFYKSAIFEGARTDAATIWPKGFDVNAHHLQAAIEADSHDNGG